MDMLAIQQQIISDFLSPEYYFKDQFQSRGLEQKGLGLPLCTLTPTSWI